jgi:hypothetical protein
MPAPQISPAETPSIVLDGFTGLKNTVGRERLDPKELAQGINIDLDDKGQPRRRRGFIKKLSGDCHSLFQAENGTVYVVKDAALGVLYPNYSFSSLGVAIHGDPAAGLDPLAYVQVGKDIYYSGAGTSGIIDTQDNTVSFWGSSSDLILSPVVNPTAYLPEVRIKLLGKPPVASILAYYNGRIYLAQGPNLWCTELYLYNYVDKTRNFAQFEDDITMIGVVTDGMYIGTKQATWFLGGESFPMKRKSVLDSGPVKGSMVYIPSELGNPTPPGPDADTPQEVAIAFMTSRGYCVGKDSGNAFNLTEDKFFFPSAARSAALFRRQDGVNQYIAVNDSEGEPVSGARFGDFVDAEIVRGGGIWRDQTDGFTITDQFTATIV